MSRFCGVHTAAIYDRGGAARLGPVRNLSRAIWNRDRDATGEASIVIEGAGNCSRQRGFLQGISSKRHELVIFRGKDRVWEGPIFHISDEGSKITISAKDVTAYLYGTMLSKEWDNSFGSAAGIVPVTTRLQSIIEYELVTNRMARALGGTLIPFTAWENLSPPINVLENLVVHHFPNEAETSAKTAAFQMTVGMHMAGMARTSGVDYTAIGRAIHLWDTSRTIGQTRTLTEADFYGKTFVTEYGADHAQAAYVSGQEGAYGEAVNPDYLDFYGPWSQSYTSYNEEGTEAPTIGALNSQAARNVSGRSPVPVEVRVPDNSSIRLNETLRITDLTPGVRVPLLATLNSRSRNQDQKLDHLKVEETPEGEDIKVTLSPATRADSDEEEED